MKKIALIMLALLPTMAGWTQDTLRDPFRVNYFTNHIPNIPACPYRIEFVGLWGDECGVAVKEMYVPKGDSLKVYGVAACMMTDRDCCFVPQGYDAEQAAAWIAQFWKGYRDTTWAECYEYLGIYKSFGDSLVPQREVLVHRLEDTPAYYVETGNNQWYCPDFIYPMYEKYFDSPIVVRDTFYLGTTQRSCPSTIGLVDHIGFNLMLINGGSVQSEYHVGKYCWPDEGNVFWWWNDRMSYDGRYYLIFPILTPDPNAPEPGDTTAVEAADMVSRYVTVQPNPAMEEARVLSSFGLERIEAYNNEGRRVLDRAAEGMEATIDVKAWPAGTYLLCVTTPMGTTTKKLLVR